MVLMCTSNWTARSARCVMTQMAPRLVFYHHSGSRAELDYFLTMAAFPAEAQTELEVAPDDEGGETTYLDALGPPAREHQWRQLPSTHEWHIGDYTTPHDRTCSTFGQAKTLEDSRSRCKRHTCFEELPLCHL